MISIVSRKGGVGKTTTAVNLAAALARRGHRCLLVDLDSQASCSLSVGVRRSALAPSLADVLLAGASACDVVRATGQEGLDLITASTDLASADRELAGLGAPELLLQRALAPVAGDYRFVLLDSPPSLSLLARSALVAADGFIVPAVPNYLAAEGVENLLATTDRLGQRFGRRPHFLGLALTMVDYRTRLTRDYVVALRRRYGRRVFAVEIRTNVRLAEAPGMGQTIFQYDPHATGARAYDLLAEELLLRVEEAPPTGAAASEGQRSATWPRLVGQGS